MADESSSAQLVASIDDLLIEIFRRVPSNSNPRFKFVSEHLNSLTSFNSLIQLKLVSKHWNSLISNNFLRNPEPNPAVGLIFERLHIDHGYIHTNHSHSYILFLDKSISPPFRGINSIEDPWHRHTKVLHSCNGLLVSVSKRANNLNRKYYVCNPTTKKYVVLRQGGLGRWKAIRGMILAFDPSKSRHYKVVCVLGLGDSSDNKYQLEVYSSETGSWGKCGEIFRADVGFKGGVYWNGAIHWISLTKTGKSIYFNPDCDQKPKVFPTPPIQDGSYLARNYHFGESCDHLHYIGDYKTVTEFNVYEMRRDYSEWFVKYKVDVSDVVNRSEHRFISICTLVRGKKDEDSFLVLVMVNRMVRCNLVLKTYETICDFESIVGDRHIFPGAKRPFQYIGSLCSV